jgi:MOSC domain-containing protein YiiM
MSETISATITGLFIGKVENRWPGKSATAIAKKRSSGPLKIELLGFVDDEQADLSVHGGSEKAIHHYSADHMAHWKSLFPEQADSFFPGCFGENISTEGIHENNLCLGDVLSMGTALVQVSQGRQPCWKLNAHLGLDSLAMHFQQSGHTGWYYRVLEGGTVAIGDEVALRERSLPDWPLSCVIEARFSPGLDPSVARTLADTAALSPSWRASFTKKAARAIVEDTSARLDDPQ